jgi:hypothetical protein
VPALQTAHTQRGVFTRTVNIAIIAPTTLAALRTTNIFQRFTKCSMAYSNTQLTKSAVGVEKLGPKTRFSSGEFLPIRVFLLVVIAYALAIAGCALMVRNRSSRFRFWATAAR